ncbi:hypothetical protein N431DRAFT_357997 [Stipitochalara longipes BDJ]|nr:hypothetical protein N431DRAFT_357997 [Stipitochalara longipes BDJ]
MSDETSQPFLPADIILCIIDFVVPSNTNGPLAYEASHTITKTLLALTRTARIIYPAARRLLYTHCLYIDSPRRLRCVIESLTAYFADTSTAQLSLTRTHSTALHATSLYLSPFLNDTIEELPTAQDVYNLLTILGPILRHLVIDMPLRSLYPEDDDLGIRRILHDSFAPLTSVELFCSARDELFLSYDKDWHTYRTRVNVWSLWPKLKTLALYNCDLTSETFWRDIGALDILETLVLTRADGVREVDLRREWSRCGKGDKKLTVWFVDVDGGHGIPETIEEPKEGDKITIKVGCVPTSYYGDEDEIDLCQNWIKRAALKGEEGFKAELKYLST